MTLLLLIRPDTTVQNQHTCTTQGTLSIKSTELTLRVKIPCRIGPTAKLYNKPDISYTVN